MLKRFARSTLTVALGLSVAAPSLATPRIAVDDKPLDGVVSPAACARVGFTLPEARNQTAGAIRPSQRSEKAWRSTTAGSRS